MADSIEQKIIGLIVARLGTVLTTNGYATNIGQNVEDSRTDWDQADLPGTSVFEGGVQAVESPRDRRSVIRLMPVTIKTFFEANSDAATNAALARNVIKDVHKAIRGTGAQANDYLAERWPVVDGTPPGLAMETREKSHGIEYAENTFEITGTIVEIEVMYISGKFNLES